MTRTKTRPFDAADYLKTEDDMFAYLEAAFEEDDPRVVVAALGMSLHAGKWHEPIAG